MTRSALALALGVTVVQACAERRVPSAPSGAADSSFAIVTDTGVPVRAWVGDTIPVLVQVHGVGSRKPASGALVRFTVSASAGTVSDTLVATDAWGHARTVWRLGGVAGEQDLTVNLASGTAAVDTVRATAVALSDADVILVHGAGAGPVYVAVTYILSSDSFQTRAGYLAAGDTALRLLPRTDWIPAVQVVAFATGRRPAIVSVPWGTIHDTAEVTLGAPFRIPLSVWVLDTGELKAGVAEQQVAVASRLLAALPTGLELGAVTSHDATGYAAVKVTCANNPITPDTGVINVYYTSEDSLPGGTSVTASGDSIVATEIWAGAVTCSPQTIMMARTSLPGQGWVVAHELGHAFGLGHVPLGAPYINNLMGLYASHTNLTAGQIMEMHFSAWSALNSVYHLRPASEYCDEEPTLVCLPESTSLW